MDELKTEDMKVVESTPNASSNGKMTAVLVVVVLVVALSAIGFLYFVGNNQSTSPEEASPTAVPTKIVERLTATPVPTQAQSTGSAVSPSPLSSGNNPDDILKDLNSTSINSFDSDFTDLQKDAAGL